MLADQKEIKRSRWLYRRYKKKGRGKESAEVSIKGGIVELAGCHVSECLLGRLLCPTTEEGKEGMTYDEGEEDVENVFEDSNMLPRGPEVVVATCRREIALAEAVATLFVTIEDLECLCGF